MLLGPFRDVLPHVVIHCPAQPSHEIPCDDFDVNAVGALSLLEGTRLAAPEACAVARNHKVLLSPAPRTDRTSRARDL